MTAARIGHGITLAIANYDSPTTFVDLGEVLDMTGPNLTRDAVDATNMSSTSRHREYIGGLRDAGEITAELNYAPGSAGDDQLLLAYNDDDYWPIKITFHNSDTWTANAFITAYEPSMPNEDKMTLSVTFKLTGVPTFTDAA